MKKVLIHGQKVKGEKPHTLSHTFQNSKGITLVALIITIIVLLILAVVAIRAVTGDGIIAHAKNAQTRYEDAQSEEESILSYYNEYLENKGNVGPWRQNGDDIILNDGSISIAIGDRVNYQPTELSYTSSKNLTGMGVDQTFNSSDYTGGWRVLGVENGNLLLISENVIKSTDNTNYSIWKGKELYTNGPAELNKICSIFGEGYGAKSARSVNVEDINKITGYNPEKMGNGNTGLEVYGNKITYTLKDGVLSFTSTEGESNDNIGTTELNYLENNEWKYTIEEGTSKTFTINDYTYYASTCLSPVEGLNYIEIKMSTETAKYKLLFNTEVGDYWLASPVIINGKSLGYINTFYFGIRHVKAHGSISALATFEQLEEAMERGIRAVVTLKEDVKLTYDKTNDIWKIVNE